MKQLKQQGSAHAAVIVVLVLALVGTLGFVFWQNFIQKDKDDTSTVTTQTTTPVAQGAVFETYSFNSVFGVGLKFAYPKDWTVERSITGPIPLNAETGYTEEKVTVTSPSKKLSVRYDVVANGGLGGACDPADAGTVATISATPLPSFATGSYTEYSTREATGYQYYSGMMRVESATVAQVNDSACDVYMANIITLGDEANYTSLLDGSIHVKAFENSEGRSLSTLALTDIEASHKTDEYKQAKVILLSTVLTN